MGGIQAKAGSSCEVHAVRGGQLILRVAPSQTTLHIMEAKKEAKRRGLRRGKLGSGFASLGGSFEGEGNDHELNTVGVGYSVAKTAKYNGRCYLMDQSMDVLEKIFIRLSPRDLALLCLTSKAVNLRVREFIDHYSSSYGLPVKFKLFYGTNVQLLLPKEEVLKERVEANAKPQLLLYSTMKYFVGRTTRVSILNIDDKLVPCHSHNIFDPCIIRGKRNYQMLHLCKSAYNVYGMVLYNTSSTLHIFRTRCVPKAGCGCCERTTEVMLPPKVYSRFQGR